MRRRYRSLLIGSALVLVGTAACTIANGDDSISFAPPPADLAVQRDTDDDDRAELFLIPVDGTDPRRLLDGDGYGPPCWSPDGTRFATSRDTSRGSEILIAGLDGVVIRSISFPDQSLTDPVWSPDGAWIASVAPDDGAPSDQSRLVPEGVFTQPSVSASTIRIFQVDGSGDYSLANDSARSQSSPTWSPDGERIAYVENSQIWVAAMDGTSRRKVSQNVRIAQAPTWSPTGDRIAYVGFVGDEPSIYVVDADGSNHRNLAPDNVAATLPAWSPDGTQLVVVVRTADRSSELRVLPLDGSEPRLLLEDAGRSAIASWSPDGQWIAVASDQGSGEDIGPVHLLIVSALDSPENAHPQTVLADMIGLSAPAWKPS